MSRFTFGVSRFTLFGRFGVSRFLGGGGSLSWDWVVVVGVFVVGGMFGCGSDGVGRGRLVFVI